jgi:oxygen-independent coproporphyrinogen-3 oxidase
VTGRLADRLQDNAYDGYAYAYPHKFAYRPLVPSEGLEEAWSTEDRSALFLYVHLPFCEMRCGFCNLFTTTQPAADFVRSTLGAISRQSGAISRVIQPEGVGAAAFGGGTPSFLNHSEIDWLFDVLSEHWPVDWHQIPVSFEVSPGTINAEKAKLLVRRGVDRISMGVQSFASEDLRALGRPQRPGSVELALEAIRASGVPRLNLDLIYGAEGQTLQSWLASIHQALHWQPEELFLYPLYVRDLTGLGRRGDYPSTLRRTMYLQARDLLLSQGYEQMSMRHFVRPNSPHRHVDYCCQQDGMIGLGPGARSYTRHLHSSTEFGVSNATVQQIIAEFNGRTEEQFQRADYGFVLNAGEQRRRYFIKSLLHRDGVDLSAYHQWTGTQLTDDFPSEVAQLCDLSMATLSSERLKLTDMGLSWSDVIGPWLYSTEVAALMEEFECR